MIWKLALRDIALLVLTLWVWSVEATVRGEPGALSVGVCVAAGILTSVCAFSVHEWGHLLGAVLAGSTVHLPSRVSSLFLFQFDAEHNDRRQFLRMSWGGFAATGLVVLALGALLPFDALSGRVALGLVVLGVAATLITELPPAFRVARGAPIPSPPPIPRTEP